MLPKLWFHLKQTKHTQMMQRGYELGLGCGKGISLWKRLGMRLGMPWAIALYEAVEERIAVIFGCPRSRFTKRGGFRHARHCSHSNILFFG
jgi:hypothetical protein